jgi:hypothetical protein
MTCPSHSSRFYHLQNIGWGVQITKLLIMKAEQGNISYKSLAYPGGVFGGFKPPPPHPKFQSFEKAWPNSQFRGIYICNNLIRIRVSLIYKLSETPN